MLNGIIWECSDCRGQFETGTKLSAFVYADRGALWCLKCTTIRAVIDGVNKGMMHIVKRPERAIETHTDTEKALNYYKTAAMQSSRKGYKPRYVPKTIVIKDTVRSDTFGPALVARPGIYQAYTNPYGAVSVIVTSEAEETYLGIKLDEFEVVEWCENKHFGED